MNNIKDKEKIENDILDSYQGRWIALWFTTSGKSYRGKLIDTEENTKARIAARLNSDRHGIIFTLYNNIVIPYSQISHATPMPVS